MQLERYHLDFDVFKDIFEFKSFGPNGIIANKVQYEVMKIGQKIYNLGFGYISYLTGNIDDLTVLSNGDTDKVLATVAKTVEYFFKRHPRALLCATGSTKSRTRQFQMGINKHLLAAQEIYFIYGSIGEKREDFKSGRLQCYFNW